MKNKGTKHVINIKRDMINRYLPKESQFKLDIKVFYDIISLAFQCNQCGKCCDIKLMGVDIDFFSTNLCDLDVKKLYNLKIPAVLKTENDTIRNFIQFLYPVYLKEEGIRDISIKKVDDACVFFNRLDNKCLIYDNRPFTCQLFPYKLKRLNKTNHFEMILERRLIPCDSSCFGGEPLKKKELHQMIVKFIILMKRSHLAEPLFIKLLNELTKNQKNQINLINILFDKILKEKVNPQKNVFEIPTKSGQRYFLVTWTYSFKSEISNRVKLYIQGFNDVPKQLLPKKPPERITVIGRTLLENKELSAFQIQAIYPLEYNNDLNELNKVRSLPSILLDFHLRFLANKLSPEMSEKFLFQNDTFDLTDYYD